MNRLPLYTFFTANAISLIGNNLTMIAVPWFVLETTGSAAKMGLVGFFTALPAILAAFFGGTVVDRVGYKQMSVFSDFASGVTVALIPLLHLTIGLEFWQLLALVFLSALFDGPGNTARYALLPDIARNGGVSLEQANAAHQTIYRGATLIGPVLAGGLIVWVGSSNVLWLDALTFAVSAGLFALIMPAKQTESSSEENYFAQLKAGLQFIRQNRLILTLVITVSITNFLDAPIFAVILPVYVNQIFGDATRLGFMISTFGGGAVLGTILFGMIGPRLPRRLTFIISFLLLGFTFFLLAFAPPFAVVLATSFFGGVMVGPLNPLIMTVAQERIPPDMRGRVFGMLTAIALIAVPLGMVLVGYLVEYFTVTNTLFIIATGYLLITIAQFFNSTLHQMDEGAPIIPPQS
jgi:MFS family permease